jgi:hypothetical protein
MNVNDPVTYTTYTDGDAGWVTKVSSSGKTIEVEFATATLLNGPNSGEPDSLHFSPGGFCGHMSGVQRWKLERNPSGKKLKFTLRNNGQWKIAGHPTKSPGCVLRSGHHHYYDYNF